MVVTILYRLLKEFIEDHGKLPRRLHLNLGISFSYISLSLSITWGDKIIYFFIFMILIFDQIFWKGTQIKKIHIFILCTSETWGQFLFQCKRCEYGLPRQGGFTVYTPSRPQLKLLEWLRLELSKSAQNDKKC